MRYLSSSRSSYFLKMSLSSFHGILFNTRLKLTCILPLRLISRKDYQFPELHEKDLEEHFVHGSGPGGQRVNKASNCVVLKHIPTGVIVKVHESRSLDENRKIARKSLVDKVDFHLNGENSFIAMEQRERFEQKTRSEIKRKKQRTKSIELRNLLKSWEKEDKEKNEHNN